MLEHIIAGLPVILSLIILEGLLSVDNALAIAAMANHLPGKQKQLALKLGILGAYVFRGIALALAVHIKDEIWLRYVGAAYLFYLMSKHFIEKSRDEAHGEGNVLPEEELEAKAVEGAPVPEGMKETALGAKIHGATGKAVKAGLVATVVQIEIMDLALSFDNVIAAVALSNEMWAIVTGVFIGILALRFVAGYAIKLLERFPILADAAFLLIGYIGLILIAETVFSHQIHEYQARTGVDPHKVWLPPLKFLGIAIILGICLLYEKKSWMQALSKPFIAVALPIMWVINFVVGCIGWPFVFVGSMIGRMFGYGKNANPA